MLSFKQHLDEKLSTDQRAKREANRPGHRRLGYVERDRDLPDGPRRAARPPHDATKSTRRMFAKPNALGDPLVGKSMTRRHRAQILRNRKVKMTKVKLNPKTKIGYTVRDHKGRIIDQSEAVLDEIRFSKERKAEMRIQQAKNDEYNRQQREIERKRS